MPLSPVSRTSLTDEVYAQLVDGILTGDLVIGEALPSERMLAEALGVSRPAVREALQRLAQTRLVAIRQGGSTTVRNWPESAGLDMLPHLLFVDGDIDVAVVRSIVEVRAMLGPQIARLAAERATQDQVTEIESMIDRLSNAEGDTDRQLAALGFWDRVVDAADSIALRLMFNELRDSYEPVLEALGPLLHDEVSATGSFRAIAAAIAAGNGQGAADAAETLLAVGTRALTDALATLEERS